MRPKVRVPDPVEVDPDGKVGTLFLLPLAEVRRAHVQHAIDNTCSIKQASQRLGVSYKGLFILIKQWGLRTKGGTGDAVKQTGSAGSGRGEVPSHS